MNRARSATLVTGWVLWCVLGTVLGLGRQLAQTAVYAADPVKEANLEAIGYYDKFGGIIAVIVKLKDVKLNVKTDFAMPTKQFKLSDVDGMVNGMKKEEVDHGGVSGVTVYWLERGDPVAIVTSQSGVQVRISNPGDRGGTGEGGSGGSGGGGGPGGGNSGQ